ncbi:MAG: 4'-phosphopantetheinyl transferase [Firmicutes bacterium HGW-Firmicutes-1]|jgi:phosphopantetheinyl transferase|nr:MAG: 4'-phosphopantetheinyl transferase [Firmicutes bacterium HGW-Firmicutes-1]
MVKEAFPNAIVKKVTIKFNDNEYKAIICICNFNNNSHYDHARKLFHKEELEYYSSLKYEKRQKSYVMGRYCAKRAISEYLEDENVESITIGKGVFNQPIIFGPQNQNLQISISHSGDFGGAIAYHERFVMGLDIEIIDEDNRETLENEITIEEKEILASLPYDYNRGLTLFWTAKEALSKALKTGLMTPFSIFEISKIQVEEDYAICDFKFFAQYKIRSFKMGQYMCSIAYPKNIEFNVDSKDLSKLFNI